MPNMPNMCGAAGMAMMFGQQANKPFNVSGMMPVAGMPNMSVPVNSKKQRELYVGNLPSGLTEAMLKELFLQVLSQCEGYDGSLGPAVLNVQLCGGGTYAFVEFRDEQCCETVMQFTGMIISGKALKINHPNGYVTPPVPVVRLAPRPDELVRYGLAIGAGGPNAATPALSVAVRPETRKSRELYVGNLTVGLVTSAMLKDLFTAPLLTLPGAESAEGVPPVLDARVDGGGKFAFVEFRDEPLATTALSLFNNMELCGRPMQVARPTGYVPSDMLLGQAGTAMPGMPQPGMPNVVLPGMAAAAGGAASGSLVGASGEPATRLLRLENLLTEESLTDDAEYAECVEDIKGECERFGAISSFVIPRKSELHGRAESEVGMCFVTYVELAGAAKAHKQLHGRDFDGNKVRATFLPE